MSRFGERTRSGERIATFGKRPVTNLYGVATGGTSSSITVGGVNYTLLTFSSDSNLVVSKAGLFDILLIGGGGGGAGAANASSAGAGGGGGDIVGLDTVILSLIHI